MAQVRESIRETGSAIATVFDNAALRRLNLALGGSMIGDWAFATAVVVWAYGEGGATLVGVWAAVRLLSMALVAPFASVLADRYPRKTVMVLSDVVRAVLVTAAAILVAADGAVWVVLTLSVVAGMAGTVFRPAKCALMPSLARNPVELTASNGVGSTIESLSFFLGPAIAGGLLAFFGVASVFLFDVVTFVWSAALVVGIRSGSAAVAPVEGQDVPDAADEAVDERADEPAGFVAESLEGFKVVVRDRDLRLVMALLSAQTVVAGASGVFVAAIALDQLDLGQQGVGYLESTLGVGAILGGLVAMSRSIKQRLAWDFGTGVVLWAAPLALVAAWSGPLAAFGCMFLIGIANPLVDVNFDTIVQRLTPDRVLGRVFGAIESTFIGAMALGALLMPALIATVGLRPGLAILGLGITALVLPWMPRLHRMDQFLREPDGLALIRGLPIFAPLKPALVERLALSLERLEVPARAVIITEGDVGDKFYIVESGLVEATYRSVPLSRSGPGEPFGEIALLHDVPRTATVTAVEDTVLRVLDRDDFLLAVTGNSEVRRGAEALVSRRTPTG